MVVWHIDDDDIQLELVGLTLRKAHPGAATLVFDRAAMALERMAALERPDALILDLNMPDVTGWDILSFMRDHGIVIPTWILTSSIDPRDRERATSYGFVKGFWIKPLGVAVARELFAGV